MSQYDFGTIVAASTSGAQLATLLNNWRDALYSLQRGPSRPSFVVPGQFWIDDSGGSTNWLVKMYVSSSAGDVVAFALNTTTGVLTLAVNGLLTTPTAASTENSTVVATTQWVMDKLSSVTPTQNGFRSRFAGTLAFAQAAWYAVPFNVLDFLDGSSTYTTSTGTWHPTAGLWNIMMQATFDCAPASGSAFQFTMGLAINGANTFIRNCVAPDINASHAFSLNVPYQFAGGEGVQMFVYSVNTPGTIHGDYNSWFSATLSG